MSKLKPPLNLDNMFLNTLCENGGKLSSRPEYRIFLLLESHKFLPFKIVVFKLQTVAHVSVSICALN